MLGGGGREATVEEEGERLGVEEGGREGNRGWEAKKQKQRRGREDPTEKGEGAVLGTPRAQGLRQPLGGPSFTL